MAAIGDVIELVVDIPTQNLTAGAQGTIVHEDTPDVYEVEFVGEGGETLELLALRDTQFILVWQAETKSWVPLAKRAANLIATLPDESAREVLDFARFLKNRKSESRIDELPTASGRS